MKTITDPEIYNEKLINRNIDHFGQAKDTPFAMHPIQRWFEYEGTNSTIVNLINNGEIPAEVQNYPLYVKEIIQKLADGNNVQELNDNITFEEYINGFKKWNERTTTSPSGRHLGHYKILTRLSVFDENNNNINLSQEILKVYYYIAILTAKLGRSLTRWCKVTTCMIEKIKGVTRIDKLRVIHLYEADYNLLLKIVWSRKGVWNAHSKNVLYDGQAGSRPGRRAIEVVVRKEMKYLYSRLTRTPLATLDNDAKSCFDRIMCNLGMAVSGYFGIPLCFRKMQATTLKNTVFRLRTAMGDSQTTYRHTEDTPIYGTGQGSCASPAVWLFISSFIMMILEKQGNGMEMHDILKDKGFITHFIEGFVDDTSLFTNTGLMEQDIQQLKNKLREDATWWAGLLAATGGKLELSKCFYYLLTWKFDTKGNPIAETIAEQNDNNNRIMLQNDTSEGVYLQQKEVWISHKTLGTHKTMVGNELTHLKYITDKSNQYANKTMNNQMTRSQAKLAYIYHYIPAMAYSLTAVCISELNLQKVQQKALREFIRKQGYEANFPRAVIFGPKKYGGVEMSQLYSYSQCQKVECLLTNVNNKTTLGRDITTDLKWLQLHSGRSTQVLSDDKNISYIPDNWFLGIKSFLNKFNSRIEINDLWVPKLLRRHDKNIMDELEKMDLPTGKRNIVNNWRIFFQVLTLSDMTTAKGEKIRQVYLEKRLAIHYERNNNSLVWPRQEAPDEKTFHIWRSAIKNICNINRDGTIRPTLGNWIVPPVKYRSDKYWTIQNTTLMLSRNNRNEWRSHRMIENKRGKYIYELFETIPWEIYEDTKLVPIDYIINEDRISFNRRTGHVDISRKHIENEAIPSSMELIKQYMKKESRKEPGRVKIIKLERDILEDINNNSEIEICSDGGVRDGKGGYGFAMAVDKNIAVKGLHRIRNTFNETTSYRAEAIGIMCAIQTYNRLQKFYRTNNMWDGRNNINIYCDNEAVINTINNTRYTNNSSKQIYSPDMDIILEIRHLLKNIPDTIRIIHVKGHQDKKDLPLSFRGFINVIADELATKSLLENRVPKTESSQHFATLLINELPVYSKHTKNIKDTYHSIQYRQYLKDAFDWRDTIIDKIWWYPSEKSIESLSPGEKIIIHKFMHKRLPCNKKEHLYYPYLTSDCKYCPNTIEDQNHVLRCPCCDKRDDLRKQLVKQLDHEMRLLRTNINTNRVIIGYVKAWLENRRNPNIRTMVDNPSLTLIQAVQDQNQLGWDQFISGRISINWEKLYAYDIATMDRPERKNTPEHWGKVIISTTHKFIVNSWKTRNDREYNNEDTESETTAKKKLIRKIIWTINQIGEKMDHPYKNETEERVGILPLGNLESMDEQLSSIFKLTKIRRGNEGG
jgi:ribonuclease HI